MQTQITSILVPCGELDLIRYASMRTVFYRGTSSIDHGDLIVFEDYDRPDSAEAQDYIYAVVTGISVNVQSCFRNFDRDVVTVDFSPLTSISSITVE